MSLILSIHSPKAFQEFLLPAINNAEHSIILNKDVFALGSDVELQMEIIENHWHFLRTGKYRIENAVDRTDYFGIDLQDKDILTVLLPDGETVSVMVDETESSFRVFEIDIVRACGDQQAAGAVCNRRQERQRYFCQLHACGGKQTACIWGLYPYFWAMSCFFGLGSGSGRLCGECTC